MELSIEQILINETLKTGKRVKKQSWLGEGPMEGKVRNGWGGEEEETFL